MWALHRTSLRLRSQGLNAGAYRASCVKLVPTISAENEAGVDQSHQTTYGRLMSTNKFYYTGCASPKFSVSRRELSSRAGASSTKEEDNDLEDGFLELKEHESENEYEASLSDGHEDGEQPHDELELSDAEIDPSEKKSQAGKIESELFRTILNAPGLAVRPALDKWVKKGNELSRKDISLALLNLRKRKMYGRALQLFEWLESNKKLEFVEKDYASRLDLTAKLRGLYKAEKYIEVVPKSFRGELVYRTLLANCASQGNLKKTEETFNKMKDLGLPVTVFACNQLLLIYKRVDKKKIADVLLLMDKENIKPSAFTYKVLIDAKGLSNDIDGMDQIVETMKAEGIETDIQVQEALARHYTSAGLKEKAEAILKDIEGENLKETWWRCPTLLRLYANLGNADEVERIWKVCESRPGVEASLAAVEAWGKLQKIEKAEAVFDMMSKKWKLSARHYSVLLKIYANNKMVTKGKDLIKRMADNGCEIGPLTWDALVRLYIQAGKVEKADSVLQKAMQQKNHRKVMFRTYMAVLEQYAKKGDVHNSEKIFHKMRQGGYTSRLTQFQTLIQAYVTAKIPAYGIRERMKADNIFPNRHLANQLVLVDAFNKSAVSDLLE
ncbi:pentatricopeptide repeat-containing protein At1g80270, mitochondrial-like isoform X2 [Abrus precatorius]|uniref:Pentatricopeptide repeat-containing protein At1g80270, mitochondrial-like isoform X2 n=1 Tax=Abrus precatorius TaxID=3816 RepID=A0A8B8MAX7_ABRPR|nr:pentatricopeptide repeat-containing protein At1g80270, mitochondrial-like isoform X2 [Abrus precatorius]